jgi:hypothetical protein
MARPHTDRCRGCADAGARPRRRADRAWPPRRREMADRPDGDADQPEAQAEADAPASVPLRMAIERGAPPSRIVLGQRPVDRDDEARVELFKPARHQTSAPPPNEKNDRKKLDAAKAIDRPKTIWISGGSRPRCRRRPASGRCDDDDHGDDLGDRPSIDSRICCSGASQGMDEPEAWAAGASIS